MVCGRSEQAVLRYEADIADPTVEWRVGDRGSARSFPAAGRGQRVRKKNEIEFLDTYTLVI